LFPYSEFCAKKGEVVSIGFGSAPTASRGGKGHKQMPTYKKYLDAEAARILKACSGNVQLAQSHFMRRKFNQLREQAVHKPLTCTQALC
jgi:hypothetical protein